MCIGCWNEFGRPEIDSAAVREAAAAIAEVYEYSCVGGNLHITLDDWNLGDGNLDSCAQSIRENVHEAGPEQLEAESRCLALLRALTEDERASALALHEGFWMETDGGRE
jgi:hypothetical protein